MSATSRAASYVDRRAKLRSVEPPPAKAAERTLRKVKIEDVWVDPSARVRHGEVDEDAGEALARSIRRVGTIEPIVVSEEPERLCTECQRHGNSACLHPKRPYKLSVGERRLAASRAIGATEIEAIIDNSLATDADRAEDVRWHENVERLQHTVWDFFAEVVRRRAARPDESLELLADRTDLSVAFLTDCIEVHERVAPDLVRRLRADARGEVLRNLVLASRIEAPTQEERYRLQRAWWADEGWKQRKAARGRGRPRGARSARRPSWREVERLAMQVEANRAIEVDGERVEVGARAARAVAALLRQLAPRPKPVPAEDAT